MQIAAETSPSQLNDRLNHLRENEPDPFAAAPEAVEAYVIAVRELIEQSRAPGAEPLSEAQSHYLQDAAMRQVRFAKSRLEDNRTAALDALSRLFRLGTPPKPDGRYEGELIAMSTGLLSDPFFDWLTRIYLPWLGKTFDREAQTGDNVFTDNAWSKATEKFGWPEYRVFDEETPGRVRVFPFRTFVAPGIEDPDLDVLKIHYADSPNPLPVRRIVDEAVELPGGYILGKAHMRGLRHVRRVAFFGLTKP